MEKLLNKLREVIELAQETISNYNTAKAKVDETSEAQVKLAEQFKEEETSLKQRESAVSVIEDIGKTKKLQAEESDRLDKVRVELEEKETAFKAYKVAESDKLKIERSDLDDKQKSISEQVSTLEEEKKTYKDKIVEEFKKKIG